MYARHSGIDRVPPPTAEASAHRAGPRSAPLPERTAAPAACGAATRDEVHAENRAGILANPRVRAESNVHNHAYKHAYNHAYNHVRPVGAAA